MTPAIPFDPAALTAALAIVAIAFPVRAGLRRVGLPPAVSLLALGILVGPAEWNRLPAGWLDARPALSTAAFVVLLLRAGLGLAPGALRRIAAPALRTGALPALAEAAAFTALARMFLFPSWTLAALAGFLVAAVSPAVILPAALAQKDAGRGAARLVPDLVMGQTLVNSALAPVAIVVLLRQLAPAPHDPSAFTTLLAVPVAAAAGGLCGWVAAGVIRIDRILGARPASRARAVAATAALLAGGLALHFGAARTPWIESVVATTAFAFAARQRLGTEPLALRGALRHVWGVAEIVLFVNLGSAVHLETLSSPAVVGAALPLLAAALLVRLGTAHSLVRRLPLEPGEQRWVTLAHVPKATIQAVFGAVPLLTFERLRPELVPAGETVLLLAALAIVATAPIGALALDRGAKALESARRAAPRVTRLPEAAFPAPTVASLPRPRPTPAPSPAPEAEVPVV